MTTSVMNPISSQLHRSILPAVNSPTSCLFNDLTCFVRDVGSGMTLRTIDIHPAWSPIPGCWMTKSTRTTGSSRVCFIFSRICFFLSRDRLVATVHRSGVWLRRVVDDARTLVHLPRAIGYDAQRSVGIARHAYFKNTENALTAETTNPGAPSRQPLMKT